MSFDRSVNQVVHAIKVLAICLFVFICLATVLLVIVSQIENRRGERAWKECKQDLESKGEHLDLAYFIPPPVPDEKNFAMTPLLKPLLDYTRDPETNKAVYRDPDPRVKKIRVDIEDAKMPKPKSQGWMVGARKDLQAWQAYYRSALPDMGLKGSSAEDVLAVLGRFDKEFAELREAARARPLSRFPVRYEEGISTPFPHFGMLQSMTVLLALHAVAELDLNHPDEAFEDIQFGFRLIDSIQHEPTLISGLVRISMISILIQPVWEGIVAHRWTDKQLELFQARFSDVNFLAEYALSIRMERAGFNWMWDKIHNDPKWFKGMMDLLDDSSIDGRPLRVMNSAFSGWIYQNQAFQNRFMQDEMLPIVDLENRRVDLVRAEKTRDSLKHLDESLSPYTLLSRFVLPVLKSMPCKFAEAQTYADVANIACAIERYRIARGVLPASLDELRLKTLPRDIVTGDSLHYRLEGQDDYILYSIGWNGVDDGGKVVLKKSGSPDGENGDWVWSLKPL